MRYVFVLILAIVSFYSHFAFTETGPKFYVEVLSSSAFDNHGRAIASPTRVQLDLLFPDGSMKTVASRGQEIELVSRHIHEDATRLRLVIRRGIVASLPCEIEVKDLSKRPHVYFCRTQTYLYAGVLSLFRLPMNEYAQVKVFAK